VTIKVIGGGCSKRCKPIPSPTCFGWAPICKSRRPVKSASGLITDHPGEAVAFTRFDRYSGNQACDS
jgi:hypothetical protein